MENIAYWIHKRAVLHPNRLAMISEEKEYSYQQLSKHINQLASFLHNECSLKKGDRVAILSQNRAEYVMIYFAIAQLGLIAVPLNIRLRTPELVYQLKDSGAKVLLYEEQFHTLTKEIQSNTNIENAYPIERFAWSNEEVEHINIECDPQDSYLICYTSGTTGRPKGAVLSQENMFYNALNNQFAIDITSYDQTLVLLPFFHIGGIGLFAFPTLLAGGTIIVPKRFCPEQTIRLIENHQITLIMGVPTIHDQIRKNPSFQTANFSSVRWFYSGGAPCSHELIHAFLNRGLPFGQGFGMTETSPTVFMLTKDDYRRKIGSIGKPAMFCEIKIVDEENKLVEQGDVGELLIKGPNVMKEYWGLANESKAAIRDGWLYTGDLVTQDEEGFVYIIGRKKEMIISGGENIYPLEVEQILKELPSIHEVAVIGIDDEKWGEVPIAYVTICNGKRLNEREVKEYCMKKLAKYKIPKRIIFLKELPKNATGKIDKKHLQLLTVSNKE